MHTKHGCYFRVEKFKADNTITYSGPWFHNIVLDSGLDRVPFENPNELGRSVGVGSGDSTPSVEQTGLDHEIATTSDRYIAYDNGPLYDDDGETLIGVWHTITFEFGLGAAEGNLTELGLRTSNGNYFNRQLFMDEDGNTRTVTVKSDEGLRIFTERYELQDMTRHESESGSFEHNGETITYTRKVRDGLHSQRIQSARYATRNFIGLSSDSDQEDVRNNSIEATRSGSMDDYVPGSHEMTVTATFGATAYEGEINAICFGVDYVTTYPYSWFFLDTPITLTDTQEFTVTVKKTWGRA